MKTVEKVWGKEVWIHNDEKYCMKELTLNKGFQCSLHQHKLKTETFYIVSGSMDIEYGIGTDENMLCTKTMTVGQYHHVCIGHWHRFKATHQDCMFIECSTQHFEEDSYRKDPSGVLK